MTDESGMDAFSNNLIPLLRERGVNPSEYAGSTLRDNLGLPEQYGLDARLQVSSDH